MEVIGMLLLFTLYCKHWVYRSWRPLMMIFQSMSEWQVLKCTNHKHLRSNNLIWAGDTFWSLTIPQNYSRLKMSEVFQHYWSTDPKLTASRQPDFTNLTRIRNAKEKHCLRADSLQVWITQWCRVYCERGGGIFKAGLSLQTFFSFFF